ncbi:arginine--tRNA ligase [Nocardia fluminea]|uniref:arginine--tRNA ligase domain-containing protein n=1 Tax=Nocardia fluminea TaxID=134984 RepID=UPI0036701C13
MNITLPDSVVWETVAARLADNRLGIATAEVGQRVLIDYSAPNVAKEMHVGRQTTIIDDSLARVLGFLGADVVPANHVGDWWTQFGMLIQYIDEHPEFALYTEELDAHTSSVSALDSLYTAARAQFDAEPSFADLARTRVVVLQAGTSTRSRGGGRLPPSPSRSRAPDDQPTGIGAVKYADLSTSGVKEYVFDPDRMTADNGICSTATAGSARSVRSAADSMLRTGRRRLSTRVS